MSRGVLVVVSGFSGAGKGTIMTIMRCLCLPPQETPGQGKRTEESIFSAPEKNLKR